MLRVEVVRMDTGRATYGPGMRQSRQIWPLSGGHRTTGLRPVPRGRHANYLRLGGPYFLAVSWGQPPAQPRIPSTHAR